MIGFVIGWTFSIICWNIYWIIRDGKIGYFDRYNIVKYNWLSIMFWLFGLSGLVGIIILVFYYI